MLTVLFWALSALLWGQSEVGFFPLEQVHPGMKGVGRTVFQGDKIEEFQVEVLGVLKNANAPKRNLIIARLAGGPLEKTGVVAGMSGSPVYVDGKLLGAVSVSFSYAKEPIAGITPIGEMMEVVPGPAPSAPVPSSVGLAPAIFRSDSAGSSVERLIPSEDPLLPISAAQLTASPPEIYPSNQLRLPLRFGGFPAEVVQTYAPVFRQMGLEPVAGGVLAGAASGSAGQKDLLPGSMISLLLLRGDLNLNIDCTVTYRQGNNLYACGHRALWAGPARIPFATSKVLVTVPTLSTSFKLGAPGEIVGTIRQDRLSAIYGVIGEEAPLLPVRVAVESTLNKTIDYHFEMVKEPYITPLLLNMVLPTTLTVTERTIGQNTLEVRGQIRLAQGESIEVEDVLSADANAAGALGSAFATPLAYLLTSFPDAPVEGIELRVTSINEKRQAAIEQVWSSRAEVRPGERIEVSVLLRAPEGESFIQKIPVLIPQSVSDKTLSVVIGNGSAVNALQNRLTPLATAPRDLAQLVRALNRTRRNNRLYALVMAPQRSLTLQGEEYPAPPPSLLQIFLADQAISGGAVLGSASVVADFETKSLPYAVRGQKVLLLRVAETTE